MGAARTSSTKSPLTPLASSTSGVVDTDIHHGAANIVEALTPYLSKIYRERLADYGFIGSAGTFAADGGIRGWRADLLAPKIPEQPLVGGAVAWDISATAKQLLDECGVEVGILTGGPLYGAPSMPDFDYTAALCRAFNDWTKDTWLAADNRFRFAMAIDTQDPEGAAIEIDRIGDDARVCAVLMPSGSAKPFGQRYFEPIYRAAARHDLPIAIHVGGDGSEVFGDITSAGTPSYYIEVRMAEPGFVQIHLESLIFEGVFDRYPNLRVAILGTGFSWVPAYIWRMDTDWKALRWHTPWVNKFPSEYVFEHVRFGSQPYVSPGTSPGLAPILSWIHASDTLMFASHYPHWDWENPSRLLAEVPDDMHEKILSTTARGTFRI